MSVSVVTAIMQLFPVVPGLDFPTRAELEELRHMVDASQGTSE